VKIVKDKARFTVIREGAVRIEYSENGVFEDAPTLFALRGQECDATVTDGEILEIKTEKLTLYYKGGEFSGDSLFADIHTGGVFCRWSFGDKNAKNLGGTLHTLDGVSGFVPVPDGLLSKDGWQTIDDSASCILCNGWVKNRGEEHIYDFYLFAYGNNYKAALADYFSVSGKAAMPRKEFFGSWYSRWWPYTADDYLNIASEYEENGFPLDVLVFDMDWHYQDWGHVDGEPEYLYGYGHAGQNLGWTGYNWNRRLIPDPDRLIDELSKKGIAVVLNDHPCDGVRRGDQVFESFADKLKKANYREEVSDISDKISEREKNNPEEKAINFRFNAGNPHYMKAFFEATNSEMEEKSIAFRWLDWQQDYIYPTVNGIKGLTHLRWLNHLYYENSRLIDENGNAKRRGMSFSRWGGFGDHKHPAWFSGDTVTSFETLDFQVQMTVSAGNAGCFFWSHDIGGFQDPEPGGQGEVYARWVQFGAMSAALRVHMCGVEGLDRRPWTWAEPFASAMKKAYALRSVLFPYIYSSAYESCEENLPLLRPLYIDEPDREESYNYPSTYRFGSSLIVSPICSAGDENHVAEKTLWLPCGVWYDYFSGEKYEGGREYTVRHGINTFPLFVKAGHPVVTQPYTSRMTREKLISPTVIVYSGDSGKSVFYEDEGAVDISYGFENSVHEIALIPRYKGISPKRDARSFTFEIRNCAKASEAECNGKKAVLFYSDKVARITVENVKFDDELHLIVR